MRNKPTKTFTHNFSTLLIIQKKLSHVAQVRRTRSSNVFVFIRLEAFPKDFRQVP